MLESLFIKISGLRSATLLKRDSNTVVFPRNLRNFSEELFCRTSATAGSDRTECDESENDDESYNEGIEAVVRICSSK